ncbi:MAG: hypothetical protein ACI8XU_001063, partial [Kiritimatiellia bacterium]
MFVLIRFCSLRQFLLSSLLAILLTSCAVSNAPLHPQTALSSGILSEHQALFDVQHYRLEIDVDPERKFIEGIVVMQAVALATLPLVELDLDPRFEVLTASIDDQPV